MVFGSGEYQYKAVAGWGGGPDGWEFGIVSSMAVDSEVERAGLRSPS